jgi:hypothetical protein
MSEQNLRSIVIDFTTDLSKVFPEYAFMWDRWIVADDAEYERLHQHFLAVFPERFFDIINSNDEIFSQTSDANTMFLPDVDFKLLFNCEGVSENTKNSIWKYLQLLLVTVIGSVKDTSNFGDALNMFESMDENDLQNKMKETMDGLGKFFESANSEDTPASAAAADDEESSEPRPFKLPKPEVLHEHMKTLMEGKLGKLAKELTEEFTEDLKDVFDENDNNKSIKDIMAQIMKDPKKIMTIMKKITDKLQNKMKNGDISQEELMKEVSGIVEKFKAMGGGEDIMKHFAKGPFAKMFQNMAGNAQTISKHSAMKERLRKKMEEKQKRAAITAALQAQALAPSQALSAAPSQVEAPKSVVVKIGDEKQEKSGLAPPSMSEEELIKLFDKKSKKKDKKKA